MISYKANFKPLLLLLQVSLALFGHFARAQNVIGTLGENGNAGDMNIH